MQKLLLLILAVVSLGATFKNSHAHLGSYQVTADSNAPQKQTRNVKGQILRSAGMPAIGLKFSKEFKYVGTQDFILYDVARAEQFMKLTAADLATGGTAATRWEEVSKGLLERAMKGMEVLR